MISVRRKIDQVVREMLTQSRRAVVGVCGLGGAGKSTLCREIAQQADYPCAVFEIDWYLTHTSQARRASILGALSEQGDELEFWRNPTNWYDWSLLTSDLEGLRDTGKFARSELWRQSSGEKDLTQTIALASPGIILCEGIYLLHETIRPLFDYMFLLESDSQTALARSASRDSHRNPDRYRAFKESVTRDFDIPYFSRFGASADAVLFSQRGLA